MTCPTTSVVCHRILSQYSKHKDLTQCCLNISPPPTPANTGHSHNAVSMLGQRRRRWTNIDTALGECPVFTGTALAQHWNNIGPSPCVCWIVCDWWLTLRTWSIHPMLVECWAIIADAGPALNQHWVSVGCLLARTLWLLLSWFSCTSADSVPLTGFTHKD